MEHEYMRTHYGEKYWDKLCGKPMPEESTPPIWKENYLLQKQYISELEEENGRLKQRIKRLEETESEAICPMEYGSRVRIGTKAKEEKL